MIRAFIVVAMLVSWPLLGPKWGLAVIVALAGWLVFESARAEERALRRLRNMERERGLAEQAGLAQRELRWRSESQLLDKRHSGPLVRVESTLPTPRQ